jgi:uncharacterized protein DUF6188
VGAIDFLVGRSITEIRYFGSSDIRIVFEPGEKAEPALYADIGAHTLTTSDGAAHAIDAEEPESAGPDLALVGARVERAAIEDGTLRLVLSDGSEIRCEPSDAYEAWQVVGGAPERLVVCTPGGDVAIWAD